MAAKTGKGKGKNSSSRLNDAMKSINNNRTPISSILPVQKQGSFLTGGKKGQRGSNPLAGPSKLLLAVSNPGSRPEAPRSLSEPVNPSDSNNRVTPATRTSMATRFGQRTVDEGLSREGSFTRTPAGQTLERDFTSLRNQYTTDLTNYQRNQADIANYNNRTLPDWTTANNQYTSSRATNVSRTSQYQKDLNKFFSKRNKSTKTSSPGSRSSISSKGSRR